MRCRIEGADDPHVPSRLRAPVERPAERAPDRARQPRRRAPRNASRPRRSRRRRCPSISPTPSPAKAEGNPLFIEEVTKALAAGVADPSSVPNSLQDVILARIDRLEREARDSLQLASVIGREFSLRLLDRISDLTAQLDGVLGELKMLELIYEKAFFPELAYMFKHALTHDVAYSTLLHRTPPRAASDGRASRSRSCTPIGIHEHYEMLAHHYEQAERLGQGARTTSRRRSTRRSTSFANREAFDFAERAIAICERLDTDDAGAAIVGFADQQGRLAFAMGDLVASESAFMRRRGRRPERSATRPQKPARSAKPRWSFSTCTSSRRADEIADRQPPRHERRCQRARHRDGDEAWPHCSPSASRRPSSWRDEVEQLCPTSRHDWVLGHGRRDAGPAEPGVGRSVPATRWSSSARR